MRLLLVGLVAAGVLSPVRFAQRPGLRAGDVVAGFEGVSRRIGVYQQFARVGRYEVYLWLFFGRSRPSGRQLAAANAELRTARLPRR